MTAKRVIIKINTIIINWADTQDQKFKTFKTQKDAELGASIAKMLGARVRVWDNNTGWKELQ